MVDMIATIATPILNLIVLFLGYASIGLAMIGLGIQLIYGIIFIWYCKQKLNVVPRFKDMPFYMVKEILGFSIYVFAASNPPVVYGSTFMLIFFLSDAFPYILEVITPLLTVFFIYTG